MRREIIDAYIAATGDPDTLIRVCANASRDEIELVAAVSAAFGVGEIPARAILDMQVRRFGPHERERLREEREDLQRRLDRECSSSECAERDAPGCSSP